VGYAPALIPFIPTTGTHLVLTMRICVLFFNQFYSLVLATNNSGGVWPAAPNIARNLIVNQRFPALVNQSPLVNNSLKKYIMMINFTNQWKSRERKPRCNPSIVAAFAVLWPHSFYSSTSPIRYLAQPNNIHLNTIVLIFLFPPKKVKRNQPHCVSFLLRINLNLPLLFRFELLSPCSTTSITLCIYCLSSPAGDLSVLRFDCQPAECRASLF